ncbi:MULTISPECIES: cupin domain-containing protein [Flavobacterium]|uniref:cupin domain-containing protein n=1 Tax=Flavobacterium TaxID=237 RepID=UPI001FCCB5D6|nr:MULTISPECIES: cupin domain-containing protein [Flavobacterium]UOK41918.1 cupin domain-containing protein [Flavobacterium enshiense]
MKTIKLISMSFIFGVIPMLSNSLYAQDPVVVAPDIYKKVVLDNDNVRVIQIELAPGESTPWHSHPNHVAYALTDGKIEITDKGKAPVAMDIKAGDALYIPAVTHMAKNLGTSPIKMVVTEIKHPGSKKAKTAATPAPKK